MCLLRKFGNYGEKARSSAAAGLQDRRGVMYIKGAQTHKACVRGGMGIVGALPFVMRIKTCRIDSRKSRKG